MIRRLLAFALANLRDDPGWRECIRMTCGLVFLRANSALFLTAFLLWAFGAPPAWPNEAPLMWAAVWAPAFVGLTLLADYAGVDGMRDPDTF